MVDRVEGERSDDILKRDTLTEKLWAQFDNVANGSFRPNGRATAYQRSLFDLHEAMTAQPLANWGKLPWFASMLGKLLAQTPAIR